MTSSAAGSSPALAAKAWCDDEQLYVELKDGRIVTHPLPEFVSRVPVDTRGPCEVEDFGTAIWWPNLDDGVGVNWLFGVSEEVIEEMAGFDMRTYTLEDLERLEREEPSS